MAFRKDDVIARPIFFGKAGLPNVPAGTQGFPCPHCGRMVPIRIEVGRVDLKVHVIGDLVNRVKDVKEVLGP